MRNIKFVGVIATIVMTANAIAQLPAPAARSPATSMLPNDPFTNVTTRFTCAEGQALVIAAKVAPKSMDLEFDAKRGIVGAGSAAVSGSFDPLAAAVASENVTGRYRDNLTRNVGSGNFKVGTITRESEGFAQRERMQREDQQRRLNQAESRNATTKRLTREELADQRDAFEDMLDALAKDQPIIVKHKYKTYTLSLERTYTGPKYVNRTQGIEWVFKNRQGTLKNSFSGRVLAAHCRQGVSLEKEPEIPGSN
jgi:hypothetical protein